MLELTVWGSRGSVPVSGGAYQRHGGATTCLESAVIFADDAIGPEHLAIAAPSGAEASGSPPAGPFADQPTLEMLERR